MLSKKGGLEGRSRGEKAKEDGLDWFSLALLAILTCIIFYHQAYDFRLKICDQISLLGDLQIAWSLGSSMLFPSACSHRQMFDPLRSGYMKTMIYSKGLLAVAEEHICASPNERGKTKTTDHIYILYLNKGQATWSNLCFWYQP